MAWQIYRNVHVKVRKLLPQFKVLEMQCVSPALLQARNLAVAVPGTYGQGALEDSDTVIAP